MFRILELKENSFRIELYYLKLEKSLLLEKNFNSQMERNGVLRAEFLHFLIAETYSFASYCYELHNTTGAVENSMLSVENFFEWAVVKRDENGFIWPPPERILNEWMKVRSWMKLMLPVEAHVEYKRLKSILKNYNENAEMFLAELTGQGSFTFKN